MDVRIYQSSKTAMQSGRGKSKEWILEYKTPTPRRPEPLMGWSSSGDTCNQVKLRFPNQESAVNFAEQRGWHVDLQVPHTKRIRPRNYGDTLRYLPAE